MKKTALAGIIAIFTTGAGALAQTTPSAEGRVVVASKPFGESYVLAEIFAQTLEARGIAVDRRPGLGATEVAFAALREGAIDVYPEYTGTGLVAILHESPAGMSSEQVFARVGRIFREQWGVQWLPPLGFENTYAIAVRKRTADSLGLRTLSDLAPVAPRLIAGFTPDFIGRADGLEGLARAYRLRFRDVRSLLQAVKYQALAEGRVDIIDGYSTDGFIARYDLTVLRDDRAFFPPYDAAALVSRRLSERFPEAIAALVELSGQFDEDLMRALNLRVELEGEDVAVVARSALSQIGLAEGNPSRTATTRNGQRAGLIAYFRERSTDLLRLTLRHLLLVAASLAAAIAVAVPLGLGLESAGRAAEPAIRAVGLLQVIPGIALLAFMIPVLGIGVVPALVALFLYSLYPILRNTYTGVREASPDAVDAATALGMTPGQLLRHVRLPLAAPIIMAGIRTAAVINVGTATLAAFIGAGGLGEPIVTGLALSDTRMILSGAIPAAVLALLVDGVLGWCARAIRPGGVA